MGGQSRTQVARTCKIDFYKFPWGAPVFLQGEALIGVGFASSRRVFVVVVVKVVWVGNNRYSSPAAPNPPFVASALSNDG